jgi:PKD repeat protein
MLRPQSISFAAAVVLVGCGGSGDPTVFREPAANILPTADFTVTATSGKEPLLGVAFDATRSNDPDGVVSSYAWDFGDGSTGSGRTTTHDFPASGNYVVSLVVTDNDGGTSENDSTATIVVNANEPPVAAIHLSPDAPQPSPSTITFDAVNSNDPDGTIVSYDWDFGDNQSGTGRVASHTYQNPGIAPLIYTVTLTVTDDSNFSATANQDVTILPVNKPPTASFTACPIAACATPDDPPFFAPYTVTFLADSSEDIDGTIVQYEWDFGDGDGEIKSDSLAADFTSAMHEYVTSGTFTVQLIVTDDFGETGVTAEEVIIDNLPPIADVTADSLQGPAPLSVVFNAETSDDPDGFISQYEWDFGDGNTGSASVDPDTGEIDSASVVGVGTDCGGIECDGITAEHLYSTIGSSIGTRGLPATETTSIAIGKVDGDALSDIVIGNTLRANHLFLPTQATPLSVTESRDISDDLDATLDIALADLDGDGFHELLITANGIVNPDSTLTGQINKTYAWNAGTGKFDAATNLTDDLNVSTSIDIGDVNGDGLLDVVIGNLGATNRLYAGAGSGMFGFGIDIGSDIADTGDIALADVDVDGDLDVLAANLGGANRLYLGDGLGGFAAGLDISNDVHDSTSLALDDLDGDGDLDLVVGNSGRGDGERNRYYLNQCDGACGPASPDFDVFAGVAGQDITEDQEVTLALSLSDVDQDGDVDLITGNAPDPTRLYINYRNVAPFDGVLFSDRIVDDPDCVPDDPDDPNDTSCTCDVEAPTAQACTTEPVTSGDFLFAENTTVIKFVDLNGDTSPDFIAGNLGGDNTIYLNTCNGVCTPRDSNPFAGTFPTVFPTNKTFGIAQGDIDDDGDTDLIAAVSGGPSRVVLSAQQVGFALTRNLAVSTTDNSRDVELVDMDNDGDLDLVVGNAGQTNKYYANTCNSACLPDTNVFSDAAFVYDVSSDLANTGSVEVEDIDGDGDLDLVAGNGVFSDQPNRVFINLCVEAGGCVADVNVFDPVPGDPSIVPLFFDIGGAAGTPGFLNTTQEVALGDIDLDGDLDLIAGNEDQVNYLYVNSCDGACVAGDNPFAQNAIAIDVDSAGSTQAVALGYLDDDTYLDLVVGNLGGTNRVYFNDPVGAVAFPGPGIDIGSDNDLTFSVAIADINGDGFADVVSANDGINRLYYNDAGGTHFSADTAAIDITTDDESSRDVVIFDIGDAGSPDARLDVVVGNFGSPNRIYYNAGVHIVKLTVTDNSGASSSTTIVVEAQSP